MSISVLILRPKGAKTDVRTCSVISKNFRVQSHQTPTAAEGNEKTRLSGMGGGGGRGDEAAAILRALFERFGSLNAGRTVNLGITNAQLFVLTSSLSTIARFGRRPITCSTGCETCEKRCCNSVDAGVLSNFFESKVLKGHCSPPPKFSLAPDVYITIQ
jgi:hypothetical protein